MKTDVDIEALLDGLRITTTMTGMSVDDLELLKTELQLAINERRAANENDTVILKPV